jgi:RNA polymerase subunit RPABC4/transcription elongation factor Spt4
MVIAIAPLALYGAMVLIPLVLAVTLRFLIVVPTRECIQCERVVAVTTLTCRHCGHRYTAEDRELMRIQAERRSSRPDSSEPATQAVSVPRVPIPIRPREQVPRMECVECGGMVALTALSCRHCGHRYTAAERDLMRSASGERSRA